MKPAIVIAAGGEGRRIGGGKPERLLGGRGLLDHALAIACAQSDCVALAVRDAAQVGDTNLPLLGDAQPGIGPISALLSAFGFAARQRRETVLLIGCDQPFLPHDLAVRLGAALGPETIGSKVAMPVSNGRYQPLAALWYADVAALADYIAGGGQSLWRFAEAQGVMHVDWPVAGPLDPFTNINDPAGLAAAEQYFSTPAQTPAR
jgi:molybdopterin-guanine dinucleotide biosynthesis protein A